MKPHSPALALLLLAGGACDDPAPSGDVFIAFQSDFADFQSWPRYVLGAGPIQGHPVGTRVGYLKKPAPAGATEYPIGAIVIKSVETGPTPQDWDLFGMAKRGGGYNSSGAAGWEFFTLRINAGGIPIIITRGTNPADIDVDGGVGHGYSDPGMTGVTCNRCHGIVGTERSDHVLSAALAPGAQ